MKLIEKLQNLIESKGIRQANVVRATGLSPNRISTIFNGTAKPTLEEGLKIARFLDVPLDYLADPDLIEPDTRFPTAREQAVLTAYRVRVRIEGLSPEEAAFRLQGPETLYGKKPTTDPR